MEVLHWEIFRDGIQHVWHDALSCQPSLYYWQGTIINVKSTTLVVLLLKLQISAMMEDQMVQSVDMAWPTMSYCNTGFLLSCCYCIRKYYYVNWRSERRSCGKPCATTQATINAFTFWKSVGFHTYRMTLQHHSLTLVQVSMSFSDSVYGHRTASCGSLLLMWLDESALTQLGHVGSSLPVTITIHSGELAISLLLLLLPYLHSQQTKAVHPFPCIVHYIWPESFWALVKSRTIFIE